MLFSTFGHMSDSTTDSSVAQKLSTAKSVARQGQQQVANQLLRELTRQAPRNVEAWLWRAATAATQEEKLACLSTILELDPHHLEAKQGLYETLEGHLQLDSFLTYISETDLLYHTDTATDLRLVVPKNRAVPAIYPAPELGPFQPAFRWLGLALLGLLLAGLGAIVFAPIAAISAVRARQVPLSQMDRARSWFVLWAAFVLWLTGLLLTTIFLIHV